MQNPAVVKIATLRIIMRLMVVVDQAVLYAPVSYGTPMGK
jgi:hypothetical protein